VKKKLFLIGAFMSCFVGAIGACEAPRSEPDAVYDMLYLLNAVAERYKLTFGKDADIETKIDLARGGLESFIALYYNRITPLLAQGGDRQIDIQQRVIIAIATIIQIHLNPDVIRTNVVQIVISEFPILSFHRTSPAFFAPDIAKTLYTMQNMEDSKDLCEALRNSLEGRIFGNVECNLMMLALLEYTYNICATMSVSTCTDKVVNELCACLRSKPEPLPVQSVYAEQLALYRQSGGRGSRE